jgi:hypothetical protein
LKPPASLIAAVRVATVMTAKVSVSLSGNQGDDAYRYQEKDVKTAIEEAKK